MKGLIVMNGYPSSEKFYRQSERIKDELEQLGVQTTVLLNGELKAKLSDEATPLADIFGCDFCVYLDKDKYLSRILEGAGVRLFNSAGVIETCDDKMSTYLALLGAGIPLATCISAPLCYTPNASVDEAFLKKVAAELAKYL